MKIINLKKIEKIEEIMDLSDKVYEYQWKVHNFTKSTLEKYKEGKRFYTNKFSVGHKESVWEFQLCVDETQIGLFLQKVRTYLPGSIEAKFSISKNDGSPPEHLSFTKEIKDFTKIADWGWEKFSLTDDILKDADRYLINDTLSIAMKLKIKPKSEEKESTEPNVLTAFRDFHNSSTYSDFTFICSDKEKVPAHRVFLIAGSPVMKAMIDNQKFEASTNTAEVTDIDSETMIELLRFMYVRKVENIEGIASKLLYAAEKYQVDDLKSICVSSMVKNMTLDNVIEHFIFAYQLNENLLLSCLEFIKSHFATLCQDEKWKDLDHKMLIVILNFFNEAAKNTTTFETWL